MDYSRYSRLKMAIPELDDWLRFGKNEHEISDLHAQKEIQEIIKLMEPDPNW